jgi:hypothetical protein
MLMDLLWSGICFLFCVFLLFQMSERAPNFVSLPNLEGGGRMALWGFPGKDLLAGVAKRGAAAVVTLQS